MDNDSSNSDSLTASDIQDASYRNHSMRVAQDSLIASERASASQSANSDRNTPKRTQHQNIPSDYDNNQDNSNTNNNSNQNKYIPYNQRSNYSPDLFTGAKEEKWSYPSNTNGWSAYDNTNPYNPYRKKKSKWKIWAGVVGVLVVILGTWGLASEHASNQQSAKPQQPRVVRKTVIEKEPSTSQNSNAQNSNANNGNNANNNNSQDHKLALENEKLQTEMQDLKMSQGTQQALLHNFQQQDKNIQPKIYHTVSFIDHAVPTKAVKRSIVSWAIQHNFRV